MPETLEIYAGRYCAVYPFSKEAIELGKKFLDALPKEDLADA